MVHFRINWEVLHAQGVSFRPVVGNLDPSPVPGVKAGKPVPCPVDPGPGLASPTEHSVEIHQETPQAATTLQGEKGSTDSLEGIELGGKEEEPSWSVARSTPSGFHLLRQRDLEREVPRQVVKPVPVRGTRTEVTVVRRQDGRKVRVVPGHESHL